MTSLSQFPGAFKPPHRGHLQLVEHLSTIADRVIVLMSPLPRLFPNQKDRGTHINVSGAGVTASSKNKKNAIKFIEFLSSSEAQDIFGSVNFEYPVKIDNNKSDLLSSWGPFKSDKLNLSILGRRNSDAVKLFDRAGWE